MMTTFNRGFKTDLGPKLALSVKSKIVGSRGSREMEIIEIRKKPGARSGVGYKMR